jgi:DNA-binding transcriptional MocR family regulator
MPVNSFEDYPMSWRPDLSSAKPPIYKALAALLERDIKEGILQPGTMLPPQRELADYLDINLSTVSRAFKLCEQKGFVSASIGRGTFVSSDTSSNPILLNLFNKSSLDSMVEMGGILPSTEPGILITEYLQEMLKEPDCFQLLNYGSPSGNSYQQEAAVKWIAKANYHVSAEHILLASGGQNALSGILTSLFQPGDKIAVDPLVYPGIKTLANMLHIQLVPVPWENHSISPEALRSLCKNERIKGIYMIPDLHNPTTFTMETSIRKEIAEIAKEYRIIIIEDAINTLLMDTPLPPIATYAPDNTIYISSLSKTISPGLRIAFVAAPTEYLKPLSIGFYNINIAISPLLAETAARLIHTRKADVILDSRKELTRVHNDLVDRILSEFIVYGEKNCNFRFIMLPDCFTGKSFELCAKQSGVQVYSAERFAVGNSTVPGAVRIAVTSASSTKEFERGLIILQSLLKNENDFTYL